jgi:hypothetical protein
MSSSNPSNPSTPTSNNNGGEAATTGEQSPSLEINNIQTPQTIEEAMEILSKLQTMKDSLLDEKKRKDSYMKRYTEKVAKCERMATLHNLIPRQLFVREDRYNEELEKVNKWSGISDQEIADIYKRKLADASANSKFKHHGASSTITRDPYAGFRDIPDFTKVSGKSPNSSNNFDNVITRNLDMMRRISSSSRSY